MHERDAEMEAYGGRAVALQGDLTSADTAPSLVRLALDTFGRLDGLVDIIGGAQFGSLADVEDAAWDRGFDHNLRHAFYALQICRQLLSLRGSMAFVASVSGIPRAARHLASGAAYAGARDLWPLRHRRRLAVA